MFISSQMAEKCKDVIYKDVAPAVIDNAMIVKALDEQRPSGEAGKWYREDGLILEEVKNIRLEFLNILRIDYLWVLSSLTKLSLSNNMIEKIENLQTLVNLKELDLSFNKIEVIENLDQLVELETLTLFSNLITRIENIQDLRKLHIFSIGENQIEERETIFHLRKHKKLRSFNMAKNPCAKASDFRIFVGIFLPQISYYEYKRISAEERSAGEESFADLLKKVAEDEAHELEIEAREEAERAEAELHAESFIEFLGGRQLFDSLFEKDPDGKILLLITEVQDAYKEYETNFLEVTQKLFQVGQERYITRKSEVQQFFKCVDDAKEENQRRSQEVMEKFLEDKIGVVQNVKYIQEQMPKKDINNVNSVSVTDLQEAMVETTEVFQYMIQKIWKDLMTLEMTLFDQLEETNLNFERSLTELVNSFIEEAQGFFSQCRNFEQFYMETVFEEGNKLMNSYEDILIPDELRPLLEDKEMMNNAVAASHDIHMQLIDGREDRLVSRANQWLQNIVNNLQKDEITRNRSKVLEINHFLDCQNEELDDLCHENVASSDESVDLNF